MRTCLALVVCVAGLLLLSGCCCTNSTSCDLDYSSQLVCDPAGAQQCKDQGTCWGCFPACRDPNFQGDLDPHIRWCVAQGILDPGCYHVPGSTAGSCDGYEVGDAELCSQLMPCGGEPVGGK